MREVKLYIIRLFIGIVLGYLFSVYILPVGANGIEQLFTVYGIVFSVLVSFAASISTSPIRNKDTKQEVRLEISQLIRWSIIDFISFAVLFTIVVGVYWDKIINNNDLIAKIIQVAECVTYVVGIINICTTAYRFLTLRKLNEKIEDV